MISGASYVWQFVTQLSSILESRTDDTVMWTLPHWVIDGIPNNLTVKVQNEINTFVCKNYTTKTTAKLRLSCTKFCGKVTLSHSNRIT